MRKFLLIIIALVGVVGLFKLLSTNPSATGSPENESDVILYWGIDCPHCEKVKEYIKNKQIDQQVKVTYKEVYYNQQNKKDLEDTATQCQIDTKDGIGVPLAYFKNPPLCLVGDQPIIDKLSSMLQ